MSNFTLEQETIFNAGCEALKKSSLMTGQEMVRGEQFTYQGQRCTFLRYTKGGTEVVNQIGKIELIRSQINRK